MSEGAEKRLQLAVKLAAVSSVRSAAGVACPNLAAIDCVESDPAASGSVAGAASHLIAAVGAPGRFRVGYG